MPYIDPERRDKIMDSLGIVHDSKHNVRPHHGVSRILTPGELNFAITALMHEYVLERTKNYATLSEAAAQASHAAAEFYRECLGPYEDEKIAENGHVSTLDGAKQC